MSTYTVYEPKQSKINKVTLVEQLAEVWARARGKSVKLYYSRVCVHYSKPPHQKCFYFTPRLPVDIFHSGTSSSLYTLARRTFVLLARPHTCRFETRKRQNRRTRGRRRDVGEAKKHEGNGKLVLRARRTHVWVVTHIRLTRSTFEQSNVWSWDF